MLDRIKAFLATGRERHDQVFAESAIELLILAMYTDGELSMAERRFLDDYGALLPWHGTAPKDRFIAAAYGRIRQVQAAGERLAFIKAIATRLPRADDRLQLFTACHQLIKSDGAVPASEQAFLADVKAGLGIG